MGVKLITGGTIINANHIGEADVLIEDEKIAAIISPQSDIALSAHNGDAEVIDASEMYVIPGGVDAHVEDVPNSFDVVLAFWQAQLQPIVVREVQCTVRPVLGRPRRTHRPCGHPQVVVPAIESAHP